MKKLMSSFAIIAVGAVVYFGINYISSSSNSSLVAQNIEALAAGEGGDAGAGSMCYSQYRLGNGKKGVLRCGTCDWAVGVGTRVGGSC